MKNKILFFVLISMILSWLCFEFNTEEMVRELDQSKVHEVGNINLRVTNHGSWGANAIEWPSYEYPANSFINRLRIGSLWFGAKKVRRNDAGQRLFWLHWPPLDEDDIVAENEPGWNPDLQLVVDTLTTVGYDGDLDLGEFLPAYNPLEEEALGAQYQMYNSSDTIAVLSINEQRRGFDDDGDGFIDEDPIGYGFPFRASDELPTVFEDYGGDYLINGEMIYGIAIIEEHYDIWFPFEFVNLSDTLNPDYTFTKRNDDDCDGLWDEDGYPVSEQDLLSYYYDYSPFDTEGERDYGASSSQSNHFPLKINVRQLSHQWSYNYLTNIIFLVFSITNMNPEDTLYDCAGGMFVDPEIGPQYWNEPDRKNDDISSYFAGTDYEFPYAYDADFDNGLSLGYTGIMLCSPDPDDLEFNCWTWQIGEGPDDSDPRNLNPIGITANEKYRLLTDQNPDADTFVSLRDNPGFQLNNPSDTRYLYTFCGDMQGMTNPGYLTWNIQPLKTMKIVIALFAEEEFGAFENQAYWVKEIYGNSQSLSASCFSDSFSHFSGPVPPIAPKLFAELTNNQTEIHMYWDNRSEIDNYDTFQVHQALNGWQDIIPDIDSHIDQYEIQMAQFGYFPDEFAPPYPAGYMNTARVNPWTGYRLRHDFQGYSLWGKPESSGNDQWILHNRFDKIDTEQDMLDYMVNYGSDYFIDFGGDLGLDTGLPQPKILDQSNPEHEKYLNYFLYNGFYEFSPYEYGDIFYGEPIFNYEVVYSDSLQNYANNLSFDEQALLFRNPDMREDVYLTLYDDRLIPLENHLGEIYVNNGVEDSLHIKQRLASRYYHEMILYSPLDDYCLSVTAWDRGLPAQNVPSLDSGKWINVVILNTSSPENTLNFNNIYLTNFPNPFNPSTVISFSIPQIGKTDLSIYNIKGQKVKQLISNQLAAGEHSVVWDGRDENNRPVSSGIYFYKLESGDFEKMRKMILLK